METEWKIGEIRQVNSEWYQCVEVGKHSCSDCAFFRLVEVCHSLLCPLYVRTDGTHAIFKKLEKFGSPFTFTADRLNIVYQRYNLPFTSRVVLEGRFYHITDKFIDIEVKEKEINYGN